MSNDVELTVRRALEEVNDKIKAQEAVLEPLKSEKGRLERMLREYTQGSLGSGSITDEQIVEWLSRNSSPEEPKLTPDIAHALGVDPRGFSKRLPRMAKDGMVAGDHLGGYWVETNAVRRRRSAQRKEATTASKT